MSASEGRPQDAADDLEDGLEGHDELEDENDLDAEQPLRIDVRRIAAIAAVVLVTVLLVVPVAALTVPPVSDAVLLFKTGGHLLLAEGDLPAAGLKQQLDAAKSPNLGLDDSSPAATARKTQLISAGFGGGWIRTFENGAREGLVQVATGVSVYRISEGASLEYQRTILELQRDPAWRPFTARGGITADEFTAYEQAIQGGHATLVYYRYANLLAQVSLTCMGPKDQAFECAQSAVRSLTQKQIEKERFSRLSPF